MHKLFSSFRILFCSQTNSNIKREFICIKSSTQKTIPYVAQKYLDDENEWKNHLSSNRLHTHVDEMCRKLRHINDENTTDAVDYDYLKSIFNLSDEEMYAIGATALDCSIMLTIQRVKNEMDLKPG